jgi:single-strand DNA-binding protein
MGEGEDGPPVQARNEVVLVGRVSAPAVERELPSGDMIMIWRLVVDRPPRRTRAGVGRAVGGRSPTIDTLDCVAWTAGLRRTARSLAAGDVVAVEGALRRRFWRAGSAAASRCEVEVLQLRRLAAQVSR